MNYLMIAFTCECSMQIRGDKQGKVQRVCNSYKRSAYPNH